MKPRLPKATTTDKSCNDSDETSRLAPAVAGACTFLAGVWLTLSPFVLDHENTGGGFDGYWNDVLLGIALIVIGSAPLVEPRAATWWLSAPPFLGLWLLAAPFVLGYNDGTPAPRSTTSDIAVGVFLLLIWLVIPAAQPGRTRGSGAADVERRRR
ncbi:SPW repeat domain-containing protein [Amycolatopsis keratiniphila]|uniref:SPW repeat domain-containing protein n=1 Tax=Amycolatopsis keratiniphila TaxID=129921 RepID=UPI0009FB6CB0